MTEEKEKKGQKRFASDREDVQKQALKWRERGLQWSEVCQKIEETIGIKLGKETVKLAYNKAIAKSTFQSPAVDKTFKKYANKMTERYEKACKMIDWLVESIEKIKEEFDSSDADELQKYIRFIKFAPTIIITSREILNQLEFIRKEQDRIKIEQKNFIYSPIQINQYLHKYLEEYVKEGKIKIMQDIPEIRVLAKDRFKFSREKRKKKKEKESEDKEENEEEEDNEEIIVVEKEV